MTAADRPSVTDNARAEAWAEGYGAGIERGQGLERTGHLATRRHELGPAPRNPYLSAGRAEPPTATVEDAARVLWEHDNALGTTPAWRVSVLRDALAGLLATARPEADTETVARVLYESGTGFTLTKGKPWEGLTDRSRENVRRQAQALLAHFHITERQQ
ncbi:hypothetical protein [Pseudactinotalea sp. Z1732]|uniref:hypothetical protein n=1 Tax=Micrococcales TaxID=85006 RepID=UPI003C7DABFC